MQVLPVYSVGCVEGSFPVYLNVASENQEQAEQFVREKRPRLDVISSTLTENTVELDGPKILSLSPA